MKLIKTLSVSVAVLCLGSVALADKASTNTPEQLKALRTWVSHNGGNVKGKVVDQNGSNPNTCEMTLKTGMFPDGSGESLMVNLHVLAEGKIVNEQEIVALTKNLNPIPDIQQYSSEKLHLAALSTDKSRTFSFDNVVAGPNKFGISKTVVDASGALEMRHQEAVPGVFVRHNLRIEWQTNSLGKIERASVIDLQTKTRTLTCDFKQI